ncbi:MAG TPA: hypothetical protein VL992_07645 [Tepidisphaeraceae bacterium]|nr:hypothetical protein [Tepidisphaeraceae bacterium]
MTKTFAQRIAITADPEFVDYNDELRGDLAQVYRRIRGREEHRSTRLKNTLCAFARNCF